MRIMHRSRCIDLSIDSRFFSRGEEKRRKERGASFLELVTTREEGGCPGCKRRNGARKTDASRRVVPRVRLLHPLERSGATVVERVTSGRVQCLAMTPARSTVQGKGEWPSPLAPLIRSCRAATRFTFASRRHCGSPSPEGGTANTFLGTCTPTPCTLPHTHTHARVASALSLRLIAPFFFSYWRNESRVFGFDVAEVSFFFFLFFLNVSITIHFYRFFFLEKLKRIKFNFNFKTFL